ncbi:MAG: DUF5693 family protein, partial [Candidatus Margulisiibacteriota bacterium]
VIRVHSVPKDELKKITKEEALDRFVRAARERGVRVIYLRPFLPPQIDAYPVSYNLKYFRELKERLENAGFILAKAENFPAFGVKGWQILVLGAGVIVGGLLLLNSFISISMVLNYLLFFIGLGTIFAFGVGYGNLLLQKILSFLAAVFFPSYAVISTFSKEAPNYNFWTATCLVLNVLAETAVGIFLLVGILFDSRFLSGVETFPAVKVALLLPIFIVGFYFFFKAENKDWRSRIKDYLNAKIEVKNLVLIFLGLAVLVVLVGRSGNFTLPVPTFEKYFRNLLEAILWVRPRTKEFLVGYPFLLLAAAYLLAGKKRWMWLLTAIGTIAPVSVFNSFAHIHTPLVISLLRTFNGLVLGIFVGWLVWLVFPKFFTKENDS